MRIQNIAGNGSWLPLNTPPDAAEYYVTIQHRSSVVTEIRFINNPTETWTVKAGDIFDFYIVPRSNLQVEVTAASGIIEVVFVLRRY